MGYVVYDDENCDGNNDTLASDLKSLIDINQVQSQTLVTQKAVALGGFEKYGSPCYGK